MSDRSTYVPPEYLDEASRWLTTGKQMSYDRMCIAPGATVLDVGCGPATDTVALAERVGPEGRVYGIDADAEMIAEADRRAAHAGVSDRVEHGVGDAYSLPFADGQFDAVRTERLFLHLHDPERAVAEMVRVTRPGGRIVLFDTDWGTRSVDTPEIDLERKVARAMAERCTPNGYSGRRLYGFLRGAGIARPTIDLVPLHTESYDFWRRLAVLDRACEAAVTSGGMTVDEVQRLDRSLREKDAAGTFFATVTLVLVSGERS